ncbi:MAG: relaxase/mobilization nuclease domain-containing protein [Clostridia bacterium]|nr:relaxase/mobilization nuclease domain-containing protein [Clostridia bacterium]
MATTKIWDVKAHVSKLLAYVANKNKTTMEIENGFDDEEMRLAAEMLGLPSDHFATEEKKFVTGINCTPENANEVMLTLLEGVSPSDIQAYHGYQSFKPGEVDADTAHAIGVQLANELWGEDFPIIVSTHIDKGHVHNHFCMPASGFSGKRYHDCNATYKRMRDTSDRLCREYGLSVIENPKQQSSKHIAEVHAEKKGIPTMRDQIRSDIDAVARQEFIIKNFYNRMRSLGYTIEQRGKFLRIKPYGYDKFFRLDKLGTGYTEEDIEARIRNNARARQWTPITYYEPTLREKPRGLYALYLHYCYLLGVIPKVIPKNPEAYAAIKEDVRRARMYSEQAKFLGKYFLDTKDDLIQHALKVRAQMDVLYKERQKLRNKMRWMKDPAEMQPIRDQIFAISDKLKPLRKEYAMCKDIYDRSDDVEKTVERVEFPQLVEQERQKSALKKNGREER